MRPYSFTIAFYLICSLSYAQNLTLLDTLTRTATITHVVDGNKVSFSAQTPLLNQIAGAPKPFYSYFWEFGDGHYSHDKTPKHTYKNRGDYQIRLWATNNYDNGKPPTTRPKKINT